MKWPICDSKSEFENEPKVIINILNAFQAKMFIEVGQEGDPCQKKIRPCTDEFM